MEVGSISGINALPYRTPRRGRGQRWSTCSRGRRCSGWRRAGSRSSTGLSRSRTGRSAIPTVAGGWGVTPTKVLSFRKEPTARPATASRPDRATWGDRLDTRRICHGRPQRWPGPELTPAPSGHPAQGPASAVVGPATTERRLWAGQTTHRRAGPRTCERGAGVPRAPPRTSVDAPVGRSRQHPPTPPHGEPTER